MVPGRDWDVRCSPLQPEQDSTVRIHILQLSTHNLLIYKSIQQLFKVRGIQWAVKQGALHASSAPSQSQTFPETKKKKRKKRLRSDFHPSRRTHSSDVSTALSTLLWFWNICQNSRDTIGSIHPQLTGVFNKGRASPINNCHLLLKKEENPRENPNSSLLNLNPHLHL